MTHRPGLRAVTLLLALCGLPLCGLPLAAEDAEARPQALLLPMPELLKRLSAPEDWLLLPLARYRELVAAGEQARQPQPRGGPSGAWIESALVHGRLVDDRELHLEAELRVVSVATRPARLPLFSVIPEHLGGVTCDGAAGLFAANGLDLIVPAAGRHAVSVHWSITLAADNERNRRALLGLPVAAASDVRLESSTPGSFQGDGLVEIAAPGARQWRLAVPGQASLALGWQSGLLAGEDQPVFGVHQELAVEIHPGQRAWRWSATLEARRGLIPALITLGLPAGWVLTGTGAGVLGSDGSSGELRLRIDPSAGTLSCSGFMAEDAAIALPQCAAAAYAGGLVRLSATTALDYVLPAGWRVADADTLSAAPATRSFAVAAPDAGMQVSAVAAANGPSVGLSACLVVGPLAADWTLEETVRVSARSGRLFTLPLQLPPGWRLRSFSAEPHATISELAAVGELKRLPAGATLQLRCPSGFQELAITAVLERGEPRSDRIQLLGVPGASRVLQRLSVVAAPGLELGLEAQSPWRLGSGGQADAPYTPGAAGAPAALAASAASAAASLRAELFSSGQPPALVLTVTAKPPLCSAEACWYVLPAAAGADNQGTWGRLDLRLRVRDGDLDALILDAPFARGAGLHLEDALFALDSADGRLVLRARQRWSGEHVLRLEGALAADQAGVLPHLRLARLAAAEVELPLREVVAVQAPASADLELHPSAACIPIDADELPAWSQPIPGAALVAAYRRQPPAGGDAGGFRLVSRTLAPAPAGFIDHLEARTQVSPQGTVSVLRLRVAAPGVQVLPLGLPPGTTLSAATIDGLATAVRREGGELVLPLPGRTQVEVALLLSGAAPSADFRLSLPRFGELPITRSSWTVAVDSCWLAAPVEDGLAMPFPYGDVAAQRPWFSSWQAAPAGLEVPNLPPVRNQQQSDARALVLAGRSAAADGEPQLALRGTFFHGSRIGAPRVLALRLVALDGLAAGERCGRIIALVAAVACALLCAWRQNLALFTGAVLGALGLHALAPGGAAALALALCETLIVAVPIAAAVVLAMRCWWPRPARLAALALLLLSAGLLPAAEPVPAAEPATATVPVPATEPVLMGYQRLDPAGLPLEVQVAVSRAALTRLWRRAHPDTPAAPPLCALATGAADYALTVRGEVLQAELSLPLAVLADDWQQLRLPVSAGSVAGISFRPAPHPLEGSGAPGTAAASALLPNLPAAAAMSAGAPPSALAWAILGDDLVVTLAPHLQGMLVVTLGWPLQAGGATLSAEVPLLAGHGGTLRIDGAAAPDLVPGADGLQLQAEPVAGMHHWSAELPQGRARIQLRFQRAEGVLAHERRMTLAQELRATLLPGRLEWSDEARIAIQGAALRQARLELPAGLAVTAVSGPALAAWRQQGAELELSWSADQSGESVLRLAGVIPASRTGSTGLVPRLGAAEHSSGRLVLVHGAEARFIRPEHPAIERADPTPGSDLALRWNDDPVGLVLSWLPLQGELRLSEQCALVAGLDQVRVTVLGSLDGHGALDALRLQLPAPWQPARAHAGLTVSVQGSGATRALVLRGPGAWQAGDRVMVELEAERSELGERFAVPDLLPYAGMPLLERQEWLLGDAGDRRLALQQAAASDALGLDGLIAAVTRAGSVLRGGERWRLACARRPGPPPVVELRAEGSRLEVSASHYLVLGQEQLRWWAHFSYKVEQGELSEVRLTLPAAASLVAVTAPDLGSWTLSHRELIVRLAAPARLSVTIDLELTLAAGAALTLDAIGTAAGATLVAQQVALVEEDELGLVRRAGLGLEEDLEGSPRLALPVGIDARLVPHRWHALRPDWQLTIAREALAASAGVDGIATLVDALTVIAPEGDLRGRASWHVLNRTRTQLELELPVGVELWEARVNGELVRPRLPDRPAGPAGGGDGASQLWLPVRPQRPGETALRIVLTWRERLDLSGRFTPRMPLLTELRTMQVLWRLVPPAGQRLVRQDGDLRDTSLDEAAAGRAHAVIAELQRLHSLGDLNDVAMHRLSDQLGALDLELDDYLVGLSAGDQRADLARAAGRPAAGAAANQAVIGEVVSNRAQLQQELQRIDRLAQSREDRRKGLGFGNAAQRWLGPGLVAPPAGASAEPAALPRLLPARLPWPEPLAVGAGGTLGPGEPPPGFRAAGAGSLLGVDLVGDPGTGGLQLQGSGFAVELSLRATGARWWPYLLLGGAGAMLSAGLWRLALSVGGRVRAR